MPTRIGVVTDTHVPEFLPVLPPDIPRLLAGVDIIFHCGDITGSEVLSELGRIAPVHAVLGNHDDGTELGLPQTRTVEVEGLVFGLTHGVRHHPVFDSYFVAGTNALTWRWFAFAPGYAEHLVRMFSQPPDVIVSGHVHRPWRGHFGDTTIFSPGAVYMPTRQLLRWARTEGWRPEKREWVQQILLRVPTLLAPPAIGIIEVDGGRVTSMQRLELPSFR